MRFEEFKEVVKERVVSFLPEKYEDAVVRIEEVRKNNGVVLNGLVIRREGSNIAPTIYLEDFYEQLMNGRELDGILRNIACLRVEHEVDAFDTSLITDFEQCREKIMPRLINAELNQNILSERPHILIEDLAVVFYVELGETRDGMMSTPVHNALLETWEIELNELQMLAMGNLEKYGTEKISTLYGLVMDILDNCPDCEMEDALDLFGESGRNEDVYVLSNEQGSHGASVILNPKTMQKVTELVGPGFYIIPSSTHEVLIARASCGMEAEDFERMVREVNDSVVAKQDILSYHIYRYVPGIGIVNANNYINLGVIDMKEVTE